MQKNVFFCLNSFSEFLVQHSYNGKYQLIKK